ncbi:MAG: GNAT family N-acetyltransferase [Solirubrobacteraceae bacterium]|nr:GNAT family N-acetyltransferase [Solirubrobacteraceae bacterium]
MADFTIARLDPAEVDRAEPLWNALREHHELTLPELGPARSREESWGMRRSRYAEWLTEPSAFALIATTSDGRDVGYCVVTDLGAETTFANDRVGCLETIAVHPDARRLGVGSALLTEARRQAAHEGLPELTITVFSGNASALGFYAHHGFVEYLKVLRAPNPAG